MPLRATQEAPKDRAATTTHGTTNPTAAARPAQQAASPAAPAAPAAPATTAPAHNEGPVANESQAQAHPPLTLHLNSKDHFLALLWAALLHSTQLAIDGRIIMQAEEDELTYTSQVEVYLDVAASAIERFNRIRHPGALAQGFFDGAFDDLVASLRTLVNDEGEVEEGSGD